MILSAQDDKKGDAKASPFLPRSGCHVKGRRWRPCFSRSKIAAPKEKRHPFGCLFSFVTAHMFCCLHSRPPQGRGSVRGEPLTGSPTRVQSPARRRPLLRSKSAAPKKKDTHVGVFLFWSGRRGSTRYRHPTNGRAIRRSPAGPLDSTRFAPVEAACSSLPATFQKENTILTDGVSFWSGRRGSNSLPRPWQGRALPDELRPQTQGEL